MLQKYFELIRRNLFIVKLNFQAVHKPYFSVKFYILFAFDNNTTFTGAAKTVFFLIKQAFHWSQFKTFR